MAFDFAAVRAPFRMQPGLGRMAPGARHLTPLEPTSAAFHAKRQVLAAAPRSALLAAPGFDPDPALAALCRHAAAEHPGHFGWDGRTATAVRLGWAVRADVASPTRADAADLASLFATVPSGWRLPALLALSFAEDLALLDASNGHIPWLAVCLPSHWAPQSKVGRPFAEVHAPVADNALLIQAAGHLVQLVSGADRWERFVWTITAEPRLAAHPQRSDPVQWPHGLDAGALAAAAWWRTEHQTFIPLPQLRQAVFTIHVDVQPLPAAITSAEQARQVHEALGSMSPAVLAYRNLTAVQPALLAWLAARAADAGSEAAAG